MSLALADQRESILRDLPRESDLALVDLVRRRAVETTQVSPLEPLKALIEDFLRRGGALWACTPCVKARGYAQEDLIEGVIIAGSSTMHERIKAGAATLSF